MNKPVQNPNPKPPEPIPTSKIKCEDLLKRIINSNLKVDKNKATMNFGWLDVGTILHEFGHLLGMTHEHQGPFSNIQWNKPLLYRVYKASLGWNPDKVNKQIINRHNYRDTTGSDFDPLSIMIYFFSPKLTLNNLGTPENNRLSGYDVLWITKIYPKDPNDDHHYISPEDFYLQTYGITLDDFHLNFLITLLFLY